MHLHEAAGREAAQRDDGVCRARLRPEPGCKEGAGVAGVARCIMHHGDKRNAHPANGRNQERGPNVRT